MIIALEGIDGAGKSTAALALSAYLASERVESVLVSSASLRYDPATIDAWADEEPDSVIRKVSRWRDELEGGFGPRARCLANAWEFAYRLEHLASPALEAGKVVIADRYTDTPLVREVLRGIEEGYVRSVYAFAPPADLVIYVDVDPELAYRRKMKAGSPIGYFEAGRDVVRGARSTRASFVAFQSRCRERYEKILARERVVRIDGARDRTQVAADVVSAAFALWESARRDQEGASPRGRQGRAARMARRRARGGSGAKY